jgi:hypothetical protein
MEVRAMTVPLPRLKVKVIFRVRWVIHSPRYLPLESPETRIGRERLTTMR